jgi:phosphoribosylanthranilate isomerase
MKQMQQLDGLDVDFAGIIFNKQSAQYVDGKIPPGELKSADLDIKKVGVFVNADYEEVMKTTETYGLDMVQLEGFESPEFCRRLSGQTEVIKTFFIDNCTDENVDSILGEFDEVCDYYTFDTIIKKDFSGIASNFDWQKIAASKIEKPFFIGGGIRPEDAPLVKRFKHPDFYGVDLNSYFEKEPGMIDMALVLKFISSLKQLKS